MINDSPTYRSWVIGDSFHFSGVSRRLRRLAGIETAFGHQKRRTRPDDDDKSDPPHSWALN